MRLLFVLDKNDYGECTEVFVRHSARSVIIRDHKVAMIHSRKYDYYKFPGGGIEKGEDPVTAMIRETREEAGLAVVPESVREYGYVHRVQRSESRPEQCFVQDNFYYLCDVNDRSISLELDDYESEEGYELEFVDPRIAIHKDRNDIKRPYNRMMFVREALVLELLLKEGYFE